MWAFQAVLLFILSTYTLCNHRRGEENAKEDAFLSPIQLLSKYGYPGEIHNVITKDGYILEIHRIPHGKNNKYSRQPKKVVLLNHGLLSSSVDWIITGPGNALGYILADAGYDVWLSNDRGNTFGRNHTYLSTKSSTFWNFDWHETGIYDLPAIIDYVLSSTKNSKLSFIGHSQGTTSLYVLLSMLPEYNEKLNLHISMAPIAFFRHFHNPAVLPLFILNEPLTASLAAIGIRDVPPVNGKISQFTNPFCAEGAILQPACLKFVTIFQSTANINKTTFPAILGHYPAGASLKQGKHYGQLLNSGHFRQFDCGWLRNIKIYGRISPPDYNLKRITSPTFLFDGDSDTLATSKDADHLERLLPNVLERHTISHHRFEHFDFVWGMNAKDVAYNLVLRILGSY